MGERLCDEGLDTPGRGAGVKPADTYQYGRFRHPLLLRGREQGLHQEPEDRRDHQHPGRQGAGPVPDQAQQEQHRRLADHLGHRHTARLPVKSWARPALGLTTAALTITLLTPSSASAWGDDDGWSPSKPSGKPSGGASGNQLSAEVTSPASSSPSRTEAEARSQPLGPSHPSTPTGSPRSAGMSPSCHPKTS